VAFAAILIRQDVFAKLKARSSGDALSELFNFRICSLRHFLELYQQTEAFLLGASDIIAVIGVA